MISISVSGNTSFCEGTGGTTLSATASGGQTPYYFSWACAGNNCGISNPAGASTTVNPDSSQYFYVQVTDSLGQTALDSIFITVLAVPIVDAGPDAQICSGLAPGVVLTPTISGTFGPYTYQWTPATGLSNPNLANPMARPAVTTTYGLIVTSGNGCVSNYSPQDTLANVTILVLPTPVADAGPDRDLCAGDSTQLQAIAFGAGPLYQFSWSPISTLSDPTIANPIAFPNQTTAYTCTAWSNNCPSYGDTVIVTVHPAPGTPTIQAAGDTLWATPAPDSTVTIQWCLNGIAIPNANNPSFIPVQAGNYQVKYSNQWCTSTSMPYSIVNIEEEMAAIPVNLFPNPTSSGFRLAFEGRHWGKSEVVIYTLQGKKVMDRSFAITHSGKQELDIALPSDISRGTYLVELSIPNQQKARKLLLVE